MSNNLDFEGLNARLRQNARTLVAQWLPRGKLVGLEWTCGSLMGEPGSSLKVNIKTNKWSDFATGQKGGDLVSLYAAIHGIGQGEAFRRLAGEDMEVKHKPQKQAITPVSLEKIVPPPVGTPYPTMLHKRFGSPTQHWAYLAHDGSVLFHMARYDPKDERKQFIPWVWNSARSEWISKAYPEPRPLYGLHKLGDTSKPILVCEGEKACDAAQEIVGDAYVTMTWPGGSQALGKVNLTPLYGRKVLLWPDADAAGVTAMNQLGALLVKHCPEVNVLDVMQLASDGWDAADALAEGMTYPQFNEWAALIIDTVATNGEVHKTLDESVTALAAKHCSNELEFTLEEAVCELSSLDEDLDPASAAKLIKSKVAVIKEALSKGNANPVGPIAFQHTTHTGRPKSTLENFKALLLHYGIIARYNVISKKEELIIPNASYSLDNKDNASLARVVSYALENGLPSAQVSEYVSCIADQNLYNPVVEWVQSKAWDGQNRLEEFYKTVETDGDDSVKRILLMRWMVSAIAAAFRPNGVSAHGVLVFQGEQYLGKTAWFKSLVPKELGLTADGMMLRPEDKDSVMQSVQHWLVELGELDATFKKNDLSQLKAFLTRDRDVLRRPYSRRDSEYARRTVFFGSVNPVFFLHDDTGNRRFWAIPCTKLNANHGFDMQQVWAEVYETLYLKGVSWMLDYEELDALNEGNKEFTSLDPIEEKIKEHYNWSEPKHLWVRKSATKVLNDIGIESPAKHELNKATSCVMALNGKQKGRSGTTRWVLVPSKVVTV